MLTVVLNNRDLDVYRNAKLVQSFHLNNVPYLGTTNDWSLYPGVTPFGGLISCARYFDYAFNMHEVYRLHEWQKDQDVPYESFYAWWTWTPGNTFTSLYKYLIQDGNRFMKYTSFGMLGDDSSEESKHTTSTQQNTPMGVLPENIIVYEATTPSGTS